MVGRGELTDRAWGRIAPLLPENGRRGKQWRDHRMLINGILCKIRTGTPWWRDLPERYGPSLGKRRATTASCAGGARAPGTG